jgi:hypothetical protein
MTASIEKIAIQLANETLKHIEETGNERLYYDVAKVVGASSQTLEEAFFGRGAYPFGGEKRIRFSQSTKTCAGGKRFKVN